MNWWQAIVVGLVEGLTEYLPVSSTGHIILAQRVLGIAKSEAADAFAICVQAGAIAAVLGLYFGRVKQMAMGALGKDPAGFRLGTNILAAFFPAALIGLFLEKPIKKFLFGGEAFGLWPIVAAWFVGGAAILAVSWGRKKSAGAGSEIGALTWRAAILIGVIQCVAMWPGVSRSLVTIVGGVLVGLSLSAAVEFSFLLGVVTLGAATAYDFLKHGKDMLETYGPGTLALGFLAAWISAVLAIKWMVGYLKSHGMQIFGYYRIALALLVAALILAGFFAG